jgi:peptidoglycan/xylan/chitin deacetylase (PgdA/CDA1 family)
VIASSTEVINFCKNRGDLAMTFDGGPGPATASVIMGLNANKVKATFHVTTEYLKEVSVVSNMRAAHESGHVIGLRVSIFMTLDFNYDYKHVS